MCRQKIGVLLGLPKGRYVEGEENPTLNVGLNVEKNPILFGTGFALGRAMCKSNVTVS